MGTSRTQIGIIWPHTKRRGVEFAKQSNRIYQKMNSPFFSIVIPIYNSSRYLSKTLSSVSSQTFQDFECILINDGSTDDSETICLDFAEKDKRFVYILKCNKGVSSARNFGIIVSQGKYIAFLDSDDWWAPSYLEKMAEMVHRYPNCSIYSSSRNLYYAPGLVVKNNIFPKRKYGDCFIVDIFKDYSSTGNLPIWTSSTIVSRKFIDYSDLFPPYITVYEDFFFWIQLLLKGKCAFLNIPLSFYRLNVPISSKPRGSLPPLEKNLVFYILSFKEKSEDSFFYLFVDRFILNNMVYYFDQDPHASKINSILSRIPIESWTIKHRILYSSHSIRLILFFISHLKNRIKSFLSVL